MMLPELVVMLSKYLAETHSKDEEILNKMNKAYRVCITNATHKWVF